MFGVGVGVLGGGKVEWSEGALFACEKRSKEQDVYTEGKVTSSIALCSLTREKFVSYIHMLLMVQFNHKPAPPHFYKTPSLLEPFDPPKC